MEKMVSKWWNNSQPLPQEYIFPLEKRPGDGTGVPISNAFPVIDISKATTPARDQIIQQILSACKEFGLFQVINHGVNDKLLSETMDVVREFFDMPDEHKASLYSKDPEKLCQLSTSSVNYAREKIYHWRDYLRHRCHPLADYISYWPENPASYRDIVGSYSTEVRKLASKILGLLCEGLGLDEGYFDNELSQEQILSINRYPPCPDPSLTLGLPKHQDVDVLTVLFQPDVHGLQVLKDGKWLGVEPLPGAFVINVGLQLQLWSAEHRVVTNTTTTRTSLTTFFSPTKESVIGPAKSLVSESSPQLFKSFIYKDFYVNYYANGADSNAALEPYKLKYDPQ